METDFIGSGYLRRKADLKRAFRLGEASSPARFENEGTIACFFCVKQIESKVRALETESGGVKTQYFLDEKCYQENFGYSLN